MDEQLARQDFEAALAARRELGPEMEDAVVDSFVDKVEQAIARRAPQQTAADRPSPGMSLALAITSVVMGAGMVPAILAIAGGQSLVLLPMLWAMIILVNMSFNGGLRRR